MIRFVNEHRDRAELNDGVDRGREARSHANHFIAFLDRALTEFG